MISIVCHLTLMKTFDDAECHWRVFQQIFLHGVVLLNCSDQPVKIEGNLDNYYYMLKPPEIHPNDLNVLVVIPQIIVERFYSVVVMMLVEKDNCCDLKNMCEV